LSQRRDFVDDFESVRKQLQDE
jgi:putative transposase